MSLNHGILGVLSGGALSGYDIKKNMQNAPFMPWSGNNNQIYKSLIELLNAGFVTNLVQHREDAPTKKIYSITEAGVQELKRWMLTEPELPEVRKMFLVQFASANLMNDAGITQMLDNYKDAVEANYMFLKEKKKRDAPLFHDVVRKQVVMEAIYDNLILSLQNELDWIETTRRNITAN